MRLLLLTPMSALFALWLDPDGRSLIGASEDSSSRSGKSNLLGCSEFGLCESHGILLECTTGDLSSCCTPRTIRYR